jgi:hypothetical protein
MVEHFVAARIGNAYVSYANRQPEREIVKRGLRRIAQQCQ